MRRRRVPPILLPGILILIIGIVLLSGTKLLLFSPDRQAEAAVEEFYTFEADGDFSDSWELLHPFMKEKFSKTAYIQDRTHVFIGHFGAETFTYDLSEGEEIDNWKMEEGRPPFKTAYKFLVTQSYEGKYGKFNFQQEVYVVRHQEQWSILWDYNQ
ncbi:hypothetical protein [Mesobacillus foraminis]|uniref:Uncharacterized protein n=1 Tax=Mesobacillus foraminis TaxID=279826 RepID=A0A4R2BJP7_9BACI|nr:hypothetical protein [Mesobacillus foraminis]TCN26702.1 hypothetical protein EV146_103225 [Mesobacillus foraminis]